ncbi:hypothetical protein BN2475_140043 [Paraburkholderia ribeironis]|uniref:Uncharacterized protein n=1 Tax=Paraburkholderia ribeironis TaxID=1247936 RepID=A0A1N7RSS7_9BURK|nr:hypothetical protein BN2475_140043 [Paraburkholderia ribeironis]
MFCLNEVPEVKIKHFKNRVFRDWGFSATEIQEDGTTREVTFEEGVSVGCRAMTDTHPVRQLVCTFACCCRA